MELALAVLLISSFTSVGLLALWAATSSQHWFLRTAVFLGVLTLLLLIPAYEPFVAFALQGVVVAGGVQCMRWLRQEQKSSSRRFSLATLLQTMVIMSVAAAVGAQLPTLNSMAWQSVVMIGTTAGLAVLVGFWVANGRSVCWWKRLAMGSILAIGISFPVALCDWFLISTTSYYGWPPDRSMLGFTFAFTGNETFVSAWVLVVAAVFGLAGGLVALVTKFTDDAAAIRRAQHVPRRVFITSILLIVLAAPSMIAYYQLMTPLPIPVQELPDDNGFDDLLAGGRVAENDPFNSANLDYDTATEKELRTAVAASEIAYKQLRIGLAKEVMMPIDYRSSEGFGLPYITAMRALARSTSGRARLSIRESRINDALEDYLDTVRLGYAIRREGLIVNALVGIAVNGIGQSGLYELRTKLDLETAKNVIALLTRLDSEADSIEAFFYRDRVWTQHATGWHGHLMQILADFADPEFFNPTGAFVEAFRRERAIKNLLCTELAIRQFRSEQGHLPESLNDLVPKYLTGMPTDPFDRDDNPLLYRRQDSEFILYSVGRDGEDDGGEMPEDYAEPNFWYMGGGDLVLEHFFLPEPTAAIGEDFEESIESFEDDE